MSGVKHLKNQKARLQACAWPRCDLGKDGLPQLFVPTRPLHRYCCPEHKRAQERDIRRAGKASNMRAEAAERVERAEELLTWVEDQCAKAPSLMNIYRRFVEPGA